MSKIHQLVEAIKAGDARSSECTTSPYSYPQHYWSEAELMIQRMKAEDFEETYDNDTVCGSPLLMTIVSPKRAHLAVLIIKKNPVFAAKIIMIAGIITLDNVCRYLLQDEAFEIIDSLVPYLPQEVILENENSFLHTAVQINSYNQKQCYKVAAALPPKLISSILQETVRRSDESEKCSENYKQAHVLIEFLYEAIHVWDMEISLYPSRADNYFRKGVILQGINKNEKALKCYKKAIQLDPSYAEKIGKFDFLANIEQKFDIKSLSSSKKVVEECKGERVEAPAYEAPSAREMALMGVEDTCVSRSYESPPAPVKIHANAVEEMKVFCTGDPETKPCAPQTVVLPMVAPKPPVVVAVPKTKLLSESGYDMPWIDPIPEDYHCPICLLVVRDAVAHTCGKLFCQGCWQHWLARERYGGKCCCCKEEGSVYPSLRDQKLISNLRTRCPECRKEIRLGDYEEKHRSRECVYRVVECEECGEGVMYCELSEHKEARCVCRSVECVECKQKVRVGELELHVEGRCENRLLPCGLCKELVRRSDVAGHLEASMGVHFALLLAQQEVEKESGVCLAKEVEQLKEQVASLQTQLLKKESRLDIANEQVSSLQTEVLLLRENHNRMVSELTRRFGWSKATGK